MTTARNSAMPMVMLLTPWYGDYSGGVGVIIEALGHALIAAGGSCVVIQVVGDGWLPRVRRGRCGETIISLSVRSPAATATLRGAIGARIRSAMARLVIRYVKRTGMQVAHFHYALPAYAVLQRICRDAGFDIVTTFHGSDLNKNMLDPSARAATAELISASRVVTTVSRALSETLMRTFPEAAHAVRVVHNAVPEEFCRQVSTMRPRDRDIDVLFVGHVSHLKGVDVLLRALVLVREVVDPLRVAIVGGGAERAAFHKMAEELRLLDIVDFMGRQDHDTVVDIYQRARVLAVPSRSEGLPLVVLEGQMSGMAVVASDIGGIPEIITDGVTGLLIPVEHATALAEGLITLLNDESLRSTLAQNGYARAVEAFSPSAMVARYEEVYRHTLAALP